MSQPDIAEVIAKEIKQHEGWHDDDDESDIAAIIRKRVGPLVEASEISLAAMQANIAYAAYKDEPALAAWKAWAAMQGV